jgi:hypothetical protein
MLCDVTMAAVRVSADGNKVDSEGSGEIGLVAEGNMVTCFFIHSTVQVFNILIPFGRNVCL